MTKRQVFIDTETTGLSSQGGHRIVEMAAVEVIGGKLTGRQFHTYLNPGRSIDPYAERVHGLSADFLRDKPQFCDVAKGFIDFVQGAECLMHNARFDTGFINAEMVAAGRTDRLQDLASIVCTVTKAKSRFPGEAASLDALIVKSGISLKRNKHSALEDAQLLAEVYLKLLNGPPSKFQTSTYQPESKKQMQSTTTGQHISPERLSMEKVIELTGSRKETFFYRDKHKRIIDHRVVNERRWKCVDGPLIYVVTDQTGVIRYVGKWVTTNALYSRWVRHDTIHHGERTRNFYLAELDAGRGPLTVWSISVDELKKKLPSSVSAMHSKDIAEGLEALWISRWKTQLLWNTKLEALTPGFLDGEYWKV